MHREKESCTINITHLLSFMMQFSHKIDYQDRYRYQYVQRVHLSMCVRIIYLKS